MKAIFAPYPKALFAFLLAAFLAFYLCACSYESEESTQESNQSQILPNTSPQNSSNGILPLQNNPQIQAPQKLADTPKDEIIKVIDGTKRLRCYMPDVRNNYVLIGTCRTSWAKTARYDVFGRIAYSINDTWFCLSAPESVAQSKSASKDYVRLKPCVINDTKQQWKVKDDLFYSVDESYFIKDDGSYLYAVSVLDKGLYTSKIDKSMKSWLDTIATPVNLSISISLAWDYTTKEGGERYFLYNNGSAKNTTELYYNLESGHIAQYDEDKNINCLYADLANAKWAWAWWGACTDAPAPSKSANKAYWNFVRVADNQSLLINHQGAALRVTRTGLNWGKPYIVTGEYMAQDNANSPTSRFVIDKDTGDWLRFIYANLGDNLPFCPAKNETKNLAQNVMQKPNLQPNLALNSTQLSNQTPNLNPKQNVAQNFATNSALNSNTAPNLTSNLTLKNPPLPSDFILNDEWRARLLAIVSTTDHADTSVGVCGICLLQSFQIIAELLENPFAPRSSGGYFFDTQAGANPFVSFGARNSLLYETLNDIVEWFPRFTQAPSVTPQMAFEYNNNLAMMSAIALLPQYDWFIRTRAQNPQDIERVVESIFSAPNGSAFVVLLRLQQAGQEEGGHAMVALRTSAGVVLVPTNVAMSAEEFSEFTTTLRDRHEFMESFTMYGFSINNIALLSAEALYANTFASTISLNDCTGEGEDRRGNGRMPASNLINQCASGRCFW